MPLKISPILIVEIVVLVAIVGAIFLAKRARSRKHRLSRLPATRTTSRPSALDTDTRTARDIQADAQRLMHVGAQWPQILATLNPTNDRRAATLLDAIRGPHMFNPRTALGVIIDGCEIALRKDSLASSASALQAAKDGMEKITRFGD